MTNTTKPVLGEAPAGDFEKPKAVLALLKRRSEFEIRA